jgi:hypothetical protein
MPVSRWRPEARCRSEKDGGGKADGALRSVGSPRHRAARLNAHLTGHGQKRTPRPRWTGNGVRVQSRDVRTSRWLRPGRTGRRSSPWSRP